MAKNQQKTDKSPKQDPFEKIKKMVKEVPQTPGVYQMLDKNGEILYIGKAKNLKNRVLQYFQTSRHRSIKNEKMIEQIEDVKYIETLSELEALILETNLIKEHQPKYNILMRDDKNYVYIKVTVQEDFPKVYTVRRILDDGAKYFGPKTSAAKVEKTLNLVRKIFKYCTCNLQMKEVDGKLEVKGRDSLPCLDYHIKRCIGPCIGAVNKEQYGEMINELLTFLNGKYQDTLTRLTYRMMKLADEKKFEAAGNIRDQIKTIKEIFMPQLISEPNLSSRDVIGIQAEFDQTYINLFQFREGKLIGQETFTLVSPESDEKNRTESFIQFYYSAATDIPEEIFIREEVENKKSIEQWLKEKAGHTVKILNPQKGKKNKTLELSEKNAKSFAKQSKVKWVSDTEKTVGACKELSEMLSLDKELNRIECYDISHLAGVETVGSMVVFEKGAPKTEHYRRFKIKTLSTGKIDDFASMEEVLRRRLKRLMTSDTKRISVRKPTAKDQEFIKQNLEEQDIKIEKDLDLSSFLCIKENKEVVAYGKIDTIDGTSRINHLWVNPDNRGNKLGYKIIDALIEKNKLSKVYIICTAELRGYYEKYGFKELKNIPPILKSKQCKAHCKNPIYLVYNKQKKEKDTSFSQTPDLIIIDGGKGQLSSALKAVEEIGESSKEIDICALAKKNEEIFLPGKSTSVLLPRNSQALYLVQRIRDEAHRFAHDFNRSAHAKKIVKSQLDMIPGVGTVMKRKLLKTFGSIQGIKDAPMNELIECCGDYIANKLKENL